MRVRFCPLQPHCFAFGGFEIQMLSTMGAARDAGVDAAPLDPWNRMADWDVVHVWGLELAHYPTVYWANQAGRGIVLTALLSYMEKRRVQLRHLASSLAGKTRELRRMLRLVDMVVVVNELQVEVAERFYGIPRSRVVAIPNIVEARYFEGNGAAFSTKYGMRHFILCTGNVCPRKNQVKLAEACIACGLGLVIIGGVLDGEEGYGARLADTLSGQPRMLWIKGLDIASGDLAAAYRACAAFALPSYAETQPISALEAAAVGKPLLLADAAYAHQSYFRNARTVDPGSVSDISEGLKDLIRHPDRYVVPAELLRQCTRHAVGRAYREVYERTIGGLRSPLRQLTRPAILDVPPEVGG